MPNLLCFSPSVKSMKQLNLDWYLQQKCEHLMYHSRIISSTISRMKKCKVDMSEQNYLITTFFPFTLTSFVRV